MLILDDYWNYFASGPEEVTLGQQGVYLCLFFNRRVQSLPNLWMNEIKVGNNHVKIIII